MVQRNHAPFLYIVISVDVNPVLRMAVFSCRGSDSKVLARSHVNKPEQGMWKRWEQEGPDHYFKGEHRSVH